MHLKSETERRSNSRCEQTIIRYIAPHVARIERDDGRWLRRLRSSKGSGLDGRLRIAVAQDRIRCVDGQTLIDGGLADAVATAMSASGRDVRIIELPWIFSRALEPLSHWTDQQQRFAAVLAERGRILGQCLDFVDRADLLQIIGQVFSKSRISVAVDNHETATKLANHLRERVPQAVYVGMAYSLMRSPEMRIFSTRSFAFANHCQIGVAFGTRAASSQRLQSITAERPDCIRIGLLSSPIERLRASDRVALESFYGPRCFDADDCPLFLPIHAAILPAAAYPATKRRFRGALKRKRMLFWDNPQRNRYLAKIGRQLQRQNATELQVAGIDDLNSIIPQPADDGRLRVAIVVESSSHARALQRYLPDWGIVSDPARHETFGIEADGHIVTLPAAHAVGLSAEVVVYAAGTGDRWIGACGGHSWCLGSLQLAVDIADDCDARAGRDLDSRVDDYRTRGWFVHSSGQGDVVTVVGDQVTYREPSRARGPAAGYLAEWT